MDNTGEVAFNAIDSGDASVVGLISRIFMTQDDFFYRAIVFHKAYHCGYDLTLHGMMCVSKLLHFEHQLGHI